MLQKAYIRKRFKFGSGLDSEKYGSMYFFRPSVRGKFTLPESMVVILPESMVVILPESKMVNLPEMCHFA